MSTCDVAIIGAGIVGAACAHEFSSAGLRVAIVEPYAIAAGATNAGQGHLVVLDDSPAQFELSKYSLQLWRDFAPQLPEECEYWKCGTVWVAADAQEMALAENRAIFYHRHGVRTHFLDQRELAALEPNLRRDLAGGLLVTEDASLRPPRAAEFLIQLARQRGASVIYQRAAKVAENLVTLADGTLLHAGSIINATGTDAAELTPGLPIRPRKGHIVVVKATTADFARHQVMELGYLKSAHAAEDQDSVAFNVRLNKAGELLVGSSRQYENVNPEVEPKMVAWLIRRAIEFMPAIADAKPLRSWAGFRAGTPDGLPLIGPCPGFQRVFAATGHEGLGATTSLATARLLADVILARQSEIDPAPYLPSRFSNN